MAGSKLTARQIETLQHIYDFISRNGFPPSITELRKAMGNASDQGVIEMLQRLEDRGMLEKRTSGQARSLKLTSGALLAIGVPPSQMGTLSGLPLSAPLELRSDQQQIYKRLAEIDPKLARMYEGGLRVLLDESNPERITLSAHSIREITYHLSNLGKPLLSKEEAEAAKNQRGNNARQLEKLFDPLGGAPHFAEKTLYDTWNKEHSFFVEVSHHGREVTLNEYRARLAKFEDFLAKYVLPLQTEIYTRLDEQLACGPSGASADDLRSLLSRNLESYRYFFRKVDVRWLDFLERHRLLFPNWETADYLVRVAPIASEQVMTIIQRMQTKKGDWATRMRLIDAAIKMLPAIARRLIDKIQEEEWLAESYMDWLVPSLTKLIAVFIRSGQHADAIRIAALMLPGPEGSGPYIQSYYRELMLKQFSTIPEMELSPYIKLLVRAVGTTIALEHPEERDDSSFVWRPAIEDHEQNWQHGDDKDQLVTALRDTLGRYIKHLRSIGEPNLARILDDLLVWDHSYSIFTRLKLHCYCQNPDLFSLDIKIALTEQFDRVDVWHEYFLLIQEQFPSLSKKTRSLYLKLVEMGPQRADDESYVRYWKACKLAPVMGHLSPNESKRFVEPLAEASKLVHADFLSYHTHWEGPTSPSNEGELAAMPMEQLVDYLASWASPKERWFSLSREGLGRTLSAVVGNNAEAFSKEAHRFLDPRIRPLYVYHLFLGLHQGLKDRTQLDWATIIGLAVAIVAHAESGMFPHFEADSEGDAWEVAWDSVFQEIGSLLESGMQKSNGGPAFDLRDDIWNVIAYLCEHPEPTPEHEKKYGGNNMDPVTLSLNTVRGRAFLALFAYIFWCDRHLGGKGENGSRVSEEARDVLERHLNPAQDRSLAVRSVYGQYFPWLFVYDPVWATSIIDRVFPADDVDCWYAAWETYVANPVFPQVYTALKAQYDWAILDTRKFEPSRRYWADPIERLAHHMMVAYIFRMEDEKGALWSKFFQKATPKQRGEAVSFVGRVYVYGDPARLGKRVPDKKRLQEFWDWRLSTTKDVGELQEFGWWVREGYFDDKWMLERLIETLAKTDGTTAADFLVLEALAKLVLVYPDLCAQALFLIVKSRSTSRWSLADSKEITSILTTVYGNADPDLRRIAANIIDHLTKLGAESYRNILDNPPQAPGPEKSATVRD